jgi:phage gpG-like protein
MTTTFEELANRYRTAFLSIRSESNKAMLRAGLVVAGQAQRNVSGPRPQNLGVVTDRLRSSLSAVIVGAGIVRVGTNVVYARIHEEGGMIFARNGRWMRFRTATGWGAQEPNKRGEYWHTVDRVRIPARPYLGPALEQKRAKCVEIIRQVYAGPLKIGGVAA